jgi:ribosomal protein S26
MRITFEKVERWAEKIVKCEDCGKRLVRRKTFMQTLNPFNVHELTKIQKDREQINRKLGETAARWKLQPERCSKCIDKDQAVSLAGLPKNFWESA